MKQIKGIAAVGPNGELGCNNKLIYHDPEDMKHFVAMTRDNTVVMGANTFESMGRKMLRARYNIVITKDPSKYASLTNDRLVFTSETNANSDIYRSRLETDDVWIIGGAQIYNIFLYDMQQIYLSRFSQPSKSDVFMPAIPKVFKKKYINKFTNFTVEEWRQ